MKCLGAPILASLVSALLSSYATLVCSEAQETAPSLASGLLSIPNFASAEEQQVRAAGIQAVASQIVNEKRMWRVGSVDFPFYDGPVARPGSLAQQIQMQQLGQLAKFKNPNSSALAQVLMRSPFNTVEDYAAFYANAANITSTPMSFSTSDENFGYQRLTIKGFTLRAFQVGVDAPPRDPKLIVSGNVAKICGAKRGCKDFDGASAGTNIFVSDFSDLGKWNDPAITGDKFVPPVVGYFCYNEERKQLLPLAIRAIETGITYTPFDRAEEWTLAKMALDAAEISYQQLHHLIETHAVLGPVQIEVMRNLAPRHPVSALLSRVGTVDFGIEVLAAQVLLNESTPLDKTFGFGAVGSTRFVGNQLQYASIENDFDDDMRRRGLAQLPIHKYARYGRLYNEALKKTIGAYLAAYYPSDCDVANDVELQSWAKACANVSHLHAFPTRFKTVRALQKVLTHLLFRITVRHHAMNGVATWEATSVPFSTPALWKKLPTRKLAANETLDVLAYSTPKQLIPTFVLLSFAFKRDVPASESLLSLFKTAPFTDEPKLERVIADFDKALQDIESTIASTEKRAKWPYNILRPAMLAHNGWI